MREKSVRKGFAQYKTLQTKQKRLLFKPQKTRLPMKSNTSSFASFFLPVVKIFRSVKLWTVLIKCVSLSNKLDKEFKRRKPLERLHR